MQKAEPPRCPACQSTEVFTTKHGSTECQSCGTKTTRSGRKHPITPGKIRGTGYNPKGPLGSDDIVR